MQEISELLKSPSATQPETTSYDIDELVTTTGHSDGTSTTVTREPSGRVTAVTSPWWTNNFTYLPSGQVLTATRGVQALTWAYDGFLVTQETALSRTRDSGF